MTSLNAVGSANKNNIIMTANGKKYEKPGLAKTALGIVAANVAAGMIMDGTGKLGNLYFKKINASVTDAQQKAYKNVVDDVLIKSGLAQKGVTLVDITEENKDTFKKIVYEDISPNLKRSLKEQPYVKEIFDKKVEKMASMVAKGKQAYHFKSNNVITINKDKFSIAAFHEMGHAVNNFSKYGRMLNSLKGPASSLASLVLLTALFKRKKADGENPEGWFDKTTTFIKNNCAALMFATQIPKLLDEGLTSIHGAKLIKNVLSPDNFKMLKKFQFSAWSTYLATAVALSVGTVAASKIRDYIAKPEEIKQ